MSTKARVLLAVIRYRRLYLETGRAQWEESLCKYLRFVRELS